MSKINHLIILLGLLVGIVLLSSVNTQAQTPDESFEATPEFAPPNSIPRTARSDHHATRLLDGRVVVFGGMRRQSVDGQTVEFRPRAVDIYDPHTGHWSPGGLMVEGRHRATATLLQDGTILVSGGVGQNDENSWLNSAEIYDPATNLWREVGEMDDQRFDHHAVLLPDGRVAVSGGFDVDELFEPETEVEIYDPATETWLELDGLNVGRAKHSSVALPDGTILAVGGESNFPYGEALSSVERYDPETDTATEVSNLPEGRYSHEMVLLEDGSVLVIGGTNGEEALASVLKYNPDTDSWSEVAPLTDARYSFSAVRLSDGSVVVGGGVRGDEGWVPSMERYNLETDTWQSLPRADASVWPAIVTLNGNRLLTIDYGHTELYDPDLNKWVSAHMSGILSHDTDYSIDTVSKYSTTRLADGRILIIRGQVVLDQLLRTEIYDPTSGAWYDTAHLETPRDGHTATLLDDGTVLMTGGVVVRFGEDDIFLADGQLYDPVTESWTAVGEMGSPRYQHVATSLQDGRVLLTGGSNGETDLSSADIYDPTTQQWTAASPMATPRRGHTATLLADGTVLVVGGNSETAEIYDPEQDSWQTTSPLSNPHAASHDAFLQRDGTVLVIGGITTLPPLLEDDAEDDPQPANTIDLYDPATDTWRPLAELPLTPTTATLLPNGTLLLTGYEKTDDTAIGPVYLFNPASQQLTPLNPLTQPNSKQKAMLLPEQNILLLVNGFNGAGGADYYDLSGVISYTPRAGHTTTALADGSLLVVGGTDGQRAVERANFYQAESDTWTVNQLSPPRQAHATTALDDGRVLVAGGLSSDGPLAEVHLFDPLEQAWQESEVLNTARSDHTASLLADGRVLVAGGLDDSEDRVAETEIFDPITVAWTPGGDLNSPRNGHTSTVLADGTVLVIGGFDGTNFLNSVERYDPDSDQWTEVSRTSVSRAGHTSVRLSDGKVLVVGGYNGSSRLSSAELYDPETDSWQLVGPVSSPRSGHTMTLLPDDTVVVAGGFDGFNYLSSIEQYNPTTKLWTTVGNLAQGRTGHTASLTDGQLHILGGSISQGEVTNQSELIPYF